VRELTDDLLDDATEPSGPSGRSGASASRPVRRLISSMAVAVAAVVVIGFVVAVIGARALNARAGLDAHDANHRLLVGAAVKGITEELSRQAALPPARRNLTALVGSARLGLAGSGDTTPVVTTRVAVSTPDILATVTVVTSDGHSTTLVHEARPVGATVGIAGCSAISNLDGVTCDPTMRSYLTQHVG
jgi:hypothetical protein